MTELLPPPADELAEAVPLQALKGRLLGVTGPMPKIGRFTIEQVIGRGAMGVVYRARDDRLDRSVAIKLLRADMAAATPRLEREAKALARLNHPNVVTVYEVGEHDTDASVFIAMEYVPGRSLREWMNMPQPLAQRIEMLRQAALGLAAAHAIGLVHRDFKPHNAIVGDDGRLRIVDFGLATTPLVETTMPDDPAAIVAMSRITQSGVCVGTPAYMAPELLRGGSPSAASDQFALCCVGWELMFGRHPFDGRDRDDPPPLPRDSQVSRALGAALLRGLRPTAAERAFDLQSLTVACAPANSRRLSPRTMKWLAGVAAVSMVGLVVMSQPQRAAMGDGGECTPTLPATASRHTLESDLALALYEQGMLAADRVQADRATMRAVAAELALGRWEQGCERLTALRASDDAVCWRRHYCGERSSLPARALCFGGDVEQCKKAAIPHEYEYLASHQALQQGGDRGVEASMKLHLAYWTELMDVACDLGDRESCDALAKHTQ